MTATEGILIEGKELLKIHGEEGVYNYHGEVQVKEKAEEAKRKRRRSKPRRK